MPRIMREIRRKSNNQRHTTLESDPAKRKFVYCISHSRWNDGFASNYTLSHTKRSVIESGVHWVQIRDQGRLLSTSPYGRAAREDDWRPWHWMRDSQDATVRWPWERMQVSTRPDPSDAGMAYFLISGDEDADPAKLRQLLEEHRVPRPAAARQHVRLEAENLAVLDGFELEERGDRNASHRLQVKVGNRGGAIRTTFGEPHAASGGPFDVDVRFSGGNASRFRLLVNGQPQGDEWAGAAEPGWKTHTIPAVQIREGDAIAVEVRGGADARLDYIQLNVAAPRPGM